MCYTSDFIERKRAEGEDTDKMIYNMGLTGSAIAFDPETESRVSLFQFLTRALPYTDGQAETAVLRLLFIHLNAQPDLYVYNTVRGASRLHKAPTSQAFVMKQQQWINCRGKRYRLDAYLHPMGRPGDGFAIEFDERYHLTPRHQCSDRVRDQAARAIGIETIRIAEGAIGEGFDRVKDHLCAKYACAIVDPLPAEQMLQEHYAETEARVHNALRTGKW